MHIFFRDLHAHNFTLLGKAQSPITSLTNMWHAKRLRIKNVEAAVGVGITGLHFKNAEFLRQDLLRLGVDISLDGDASEDQLEPAEGQTL